MNKRWIRTKKVLVNYQIVVFSYFLDYSKKENSNVFVIRRANTFLPCILCKVIFYKVFSVPNYKQSPF